MLATMLALVLSGTLLLPADDVRPPPKKQRTEALRATMHVTMQRRTIKIVAADGESAEEVLWVVGGGDWIKEASAVVRKLAEVAQWRVIFLENWR